MIRLFGKKNRDLNAETRRKRIRRFYLILFIVLAVVCLYISAVCATYRNTTDEKNAVAGIVYGIKNIADIGFNFNLNGPYTLRTFLIWLFIWGAICGLLWTQEQKTHHDMIDIESGSAQWNDDLKGYNKKFGDVDPFNTTILSKHVSLSMDDYRTQRNSNVLVVGGTGTGKSRFYVKPNILQCNANYVINDPASDLLLSTGNILKSKGYDIKVLNLIDASKSNCYNPFHYLRNEMNVMSMIHCLIENTTPPNEHSGDPFWEKAETNLLQAIVFYLWQHRPVEDQNFATVMKLMRMAEVKESQEDFRSPLDRIFLKPPTKHEADAADTANQNERERNIYSAEFMDWQEKTLYWKDGRIVKNTALLSLEEIDDTDIAVKMYRTFRITAGKTAKSILTSCMSRLQAFNIPAICALTNSDNIHLEELSGTIEGHEKQAIYMVLPQADDTYSFLVSMLYTQMFERLEYIGSHLPNSRLPRNVKCIMDEFVNTARIPQFDKVISVIRKYGISCDVILQSLSQIKSAYEKEWETIIGNCDSKLFLGSSENTTTEYFSKLMGNQTIITADRSSSSGKNQHSSRSYKNTQRALMYPDEIAGMSNSKCLVIIRGVDPFFDDKYDYISHPRYKDTGDANAANTYPLQKMSTDNFAEEAEIRAQQMRAMQYHEIKLIEDEKAFLAECPAWKEDFSEIYEKFSVISIPEDSDDTHNGEKKPEDVKTAIQLKGDRKIIISPITNCKAPEIPYDPGDDEIGRQIADLQKQKTVNTERPPKAVWGVKKVSISSRLIEEEEE